MNWFWFRNGLASDKFPCLYSAGLHMRFNRNYSQIVWQKCLYLLHYHHFNDDWCLCSFLKTKIIKHVLEIIRDTLVGNCWECRQIDCRGRTGGMVMRNFCSPRAHELDVQPLHHGSLLSLIPVPGELTPLLASEGTRLTCR